MHVLKKIGKILLWCLGILILGILIMVIWFVTVVKIEEPPLPENAETVLQWKRETISPEFYKVENDWLKKSETGLWEMYVSGTGFERGVKEGKLHKELADFQEEAFVNQLKKLIPNEGTLNYLKYFIAFFNRNLEDHITLEYQQEIYGESLFASDDYDFIAPKYHRLLNYHAAHDIGHAIQDKNMHVGCTSFGAWGENTQDSNLLLARNFDFYVGEDFAKNTIINFVNPSDGYKMMFVSWAGMIGAVSGMNEMGLTVTINASKSEIPTAAATPISLVSREILQYAKNIEEALAIAKKRKVFVSESILIGSQMDGKTAIIEMSPSKVSLMEPSKEYLICSNHFQSDGFKEDPVNIKNIEESSSGYRYNRMHQLMEGFEPMDVANAVTILRDKQGMDGKDIGLGNEKAMNQLIAHHGIVFKPEEQKVWVSTNPYQLGAFICYDLKKVFGLANDLDANTEIYNKAESIPADSFLYSEEYKRFLVFKKLKEEFSSNKGRDLESKIELLIGSNPQNYEVYSIAGNYYRQNGQKEMAVKYYEKALSKEVATKTEEREFREIIKELERAE